MKNIFLLVALISFLFACKKESNVPSTPLNDLIINTLDCGNEKVVGVLKQGEVASSVTATISYTGGNGKSYNTLNFPSVGVTGLTATLASGTVANGDGTLTFTISGNPTSTGEASFAISIGGQSCSITISVNGYGSDITDIDGNTYKTVIIGTQQWMGENLKVSKYNDGTTISNVVDAVEWGNLLTAAWSTYNNDLANNLSYGKLYNWYVVNPSENGNKNVCPSGWHVPTDLEWTVLTNYLGGDSYAGGKMKEVGTSNWGSPNIGATNTSLFTALPGGDRYINGNYVNKGYSGYWWSSSEFDADKGVGRYLYRDMGNVKNSNSDKKTGMSIRCLKD